MNKTRQFIFGFLLFSSLACTKDTGTIKVTYHEATAVYGILDDIRQQPLNESPREISNPGKIYVGDRIILIGEEEKGVHVVDNTNSAAPVRVNFINIPGNREFFVKDNFLYAESYYDVVKLDISDPRNVRLVARAENVFAEPEAFLNDQGEALLGFTFQKVTKEVDQNSDLYAEINQENWVYYDFARKIIPQSAVPASFAGNSNQSDGTVNRIAYYQGYVYIVGRHDLNVLSDGASFELAATQKYAGNEMETVFPYKNKLFIGSRSAVEIFDLSDPANPQHQFRFDHATSCDPVLPEDDAAYISLRTGDFSECPGDINALVVLDIANLDRPEEVDEIQMRSPYGMALIGDLLFVGEGENGLTIFDASDRLNLEQIYRDETIRAYDVLEHPTRNDLILIAGPDGLEQYITNDALSFQMESRIAF